MKISKKFVVLLSIIVVASCATNREIVRRNTKELLQKYRGETNQKIAIIPFMTKSQQKNPELEAFDDEVMDVVFEDKRFQIVERSLIEQITKEWTFSESGLVDEEQRSKIGKLSGAKLILVPIVSGERNINMRIISVSTGDVLSYVRANLATPIVAGISEAPRQMPARKDVPVVVPGSGTFTVGSGGSLATFGELLIQLETSVNFSAQESNWRNRRPSWLTDVRSAGSSNNFQRMKDLVLEFERNILTSAQNSNWLSTSRSSWVQRVRNAQSMQELANLLIECENNILYSAQDNSWRDRRNGWLSQMRALR